MCWSRFLCGQFIFSLPPPLTAAFFFLIFAPNLHGTARASPALSKSGDEAKYYDRRGVPELIVYIQFIYCGRILYYRIFHKYTCILRLHYLIFHSVIGSKYSFDMQYKF